MAPRDDSMQAPYGAAELGPLAVSLAAAPARAANEAEADRRLAEQLLWQRLIEHRDPQAREALIMLHLPTARIAAAGLYARHVHHETEFGDYMQWATLGMIEAIDRYDPARGAQFRTYAHTRMLGAIRDGLERISERQGQLGLHRRLMAERLAAVKAGKVLDAADDLRLVREMADIGAGLMLSFMLDDTGMLQGADEALPDRCYESIVFKQEQQRVRELIPQLTPREQSVIRLHYLQGLTYEDIARTLGITRGRVAQLHAQALGRLRGLVGG